MIIAESYGGRDEPVDTLVASLVNVNVVPLLDPLRVKAPPTESTYQARTRSCLGSAAPCCETRAWLRLLHIIMTA